MKALAVLAFILGVIAFLFPAARDRDSREEAREKTVATNYVVFREAVLRHVFAARPTGEVPYAVLALPTGWQPLREWQARVQGGRCLIWGPASSGEIAAARDLLLGSLAVGRAQGGLLVPGYGANVPVPGIPDDALVSVVNME